MENIYQLRWKSRVHDQLRTVPDRIRADTIHAILNLRDEPYPPDAEELRDHYQGIWKIKVDGWRILYRVDEAEKVVTVITVKRGDRNTYIHLYSLLL